MKAQTSQLTCGTIGRISDEILIIPLCNKWTTLYLVVQVEAVTTLTIDKTACLDPEPLAARCLSGYTHACMHELFAVVFVVACADICDCGSLKALFAENQ